MFAEMSLSILKDKNKNLQGRRNAVSPIFFVAKFFGHNIRYCKLINQKWNDLTLVNNVIFTYQLCNLLTDSEIQHSI